ncbi:MAG: cold shock domain-containing protein [Planctomycetota bacterium]|nr:cold shock domain-containing protein [Planctomycetota bacterium]
MSHSEDSPSPEKRFRIQRRRLGKITFIDAEGKYGFIDGEDFREDVFFHTSVWEIPEAQKSTQPIPRPDPGLWVEFELNDEFREAENRLRAKVVRPTNRPNGRKLSGRDATFNIITHHENSRRKKPSWRKK